MTQDLWKAVDGYLVEKLIRPDHVLDETMRANAKASLPAIDVSPTQGKLLNLLVQIKGARRILEIGTLGGYSTIWLARALPADGKLITLEFEKKHLEVARKNIARAGLSSLVEFRLGAALDSLQELLNERVSPFDFIFIDADKPNNPVYFEWSLRLSRPGTVIVVDNLIRKGAVVDADNTDPSIEGSRRFFDLLAADSRVDATALQTVGSKGYDGFALVIVH